MSVGKALRRGAFGAAILMAGLWSGDVSAQIRRQASSGEHSFSEIALPGAAECQAAGGYACYAPTNLLMDPDGDHLWIGFQFGREGRRGGIGRINLDGSDFQFFNEGLELGSSVTDIAFGPDGALWFTDFHHRTFGRMTREGQFTQWKSPGLMRIPDGPVSTSIQAELQPLPYQIVQGRDGLMYYSVQDVYGGSRPNFSSGFVGRFSVEDPLGTMQKFALPGLPSGMLNGVDGNVWVIHFPRWSDKQGGGLTRITPAGEVTTHDLPFAENASEAERTYGTAITTAELANGPDGDIWFTQEFYRHVGRFRPSTGEFTFYTVPAERTHMVRLIAARDSNMYVGDYQGFWKITQSGQISSVELPERRQGGWAVVQGPNGNLWYAHRFSDTLGIMSVPRARR